MSICSSNRRSGKRDTFRRILVSAGILSFGAVFLSGCGSVSVIGGGNGSIFTVGGENCSKQEAKAILLQYQKECSSVYGQDLWNNSGVDQAELAAYVKNSAVSQLAWVYALDAVAEDRGIGLSEAETEQTQNAAAYYLDSMNDEELDYIGISDSDAQQLFERYLLAEKAYSSIIEGVSTEVSDNEALVMDMQQICVSDVNLADEILTRIREGEDFPALAETYSEDETVDLAVSRTTFDDAVTEILFSMDTGDYSDVIGIDGMYYIFYCENYYDEALTRQNRGVVLQSRRQSAVKEACDLCADPDDSVLRNNALSGIEVDPSMDLSGATFREVYQLYFG